jgi:hypothetical protein
MATGSTQFERRPYHGSCHCGTVKYIVFLNLPTVNSVAPDATTMQDQSGLQMYKCNCTVCHKMGIFHLRLRDAPNDFYLLSPSDPTIAGSGVASYRCNAMASVWYFCTTCGVRCFTLRGNSEIEEVELEGKKVKVWKAATEGWREASGPRPRPSYFSINAITLDVGQKGLDLRQWHENGWIRYVDSLDGTVGAWEKPQRGGTY